jgi:hypothetical protein
MSGRTERVNARELSDRIDTIMFEGETARGWLQQLARRSQVALQAAQANRFFSAECNEEVDELRAAYEALERAERALELLSSAVEKREGKAA